MPPTPSRPTRRHAPPGPPRPAAPHDPEAPSDSYSTALTWTPSFPTDEVSGKPGVVQTTPVTMPTTPVTMPTTPVTMPTKHPNGGCISDEGIVCKIDDGQHSSPHDRGHWRQHTRHRAAAGTQAGNRANVAYGY